MKIIEKLPIFTWIEVNDNDAEEITTSMIEERKILFVEEDSDIYEGEWLNDKKDGKGVQLYGDGSRYDGFWKDGEYHGHGRLISITGDIYIG